MRVRVGAVDLLHEENGKGSCRENHNQSNRGESKRKGDLPECAERLKSETAKADCDANLETTGDF
jgi:hypothetical protein